MNAATGQEAAGTACAVSQQLASNIAAPNNASSDSAAQSGSSKSHHIAGKLGTTLQAADIT